MADDTTYSSLCGWRDIDAIQQVFAGQFPTLAQAAPHLMGAPAPTGPILLYKAWRDVLGQDPAYPAQQIGDCVSFGHGHGNDLLQCIEIGLGEPAVFQETDTEFIYATSREVAGILGRQDGSYGSAAVKAMTTIGMVSRKMLGPDGTYSGQRAKDWGWHGAPASVKSEAAPYKLGASAQVSTWDELVAALNNGYPVTICTGQGFTLARDNDGFCQARGSWGHCMLIAGVRFDRPGACIIQSWGPDMPSGPTALDQPSFSFWAEQGVIERILGQGDSWALSKSPAFEERELPPAWKYHDAA
jgi:hypothetical protein